MSIVGKIMGIAEKNNAQLYQHNGLTPNSDCSMPAIVIFNYGDSDIPLYLLVTFKPATQLIFKIDSVWDLSMLFVCMSVP